MLEKSFAVLVATFCVVLLVRLFMPERYRWRLDAQAKRTWQALRAWALRVWRWRSTRKEASRIAEEAIRRARNGVQRDGNVLRPKSFKRQRDTGEPRKPH